MGGLDDGGNARIAALQGDAIDVARDPVLQELTAEATALVNAKWSAVTVLLRFTLIYRAADHVPHARLTTRAVGSLCERVVQGRKGIVVADLANDTGSMDDARRTMGVRSYVGLPISIGNVVVGALCAHSDRPGEFSHSDIDKLAPLARAASERVTLLASRRDPRQRLVEMALRPAYAEIRNNLTPMRADLLGAQDLLAKLSTEAMEARFQATQSLEGLAKAMSDVRSATERVMEQLAALHILSNGEERAVVADVVRASDELAHHDTRLVGGVHWTNKAPSVALDVSTRSSVTVIAASLSLLAREMITDQHRRGISVLVGHDYGLVRFSMRTALALSRVRDCATSVGDLIGDTGIDVRCQDDLLEVILPAA